MENYQAMHAQYLNTETGTDYL